MDENRNPSISIVESDLNHAVLLEGLLEDEYDVNVIANAKDALTEVHSNRPDFIFLNVKLPDMSGYELCQQLRQDSALDETKIFFVSSCSDVDSILQGYDAGADDYIVKPVVANELLSKIEASTQNSNMLQDLKNSANSATETALAVMENSGDLGLIIDFLKNSYRCQSLDELAKLLLDALATWELSCIVQIRNNAAAKNYSHTGNISDLELRLIEASLEKGSIIQFNHRCIFSDDIITVIVKNMPIDDEVKTGRYRDNVIILVNGANEKAKAILTQQELSLKSRLDSIMSRIHDELEQIDKQLKDYNALTVSAIQSFIDSMQDAFLHSGLTEAQEEHFLQLAEGALEKVLSISSNGNVIDQALETIIDEIGKISPT